MHHWGWTQLCVLIERFIPTDQIKPSTKYYDVQGTLVCCTKILNVVLRKIKFHFDIRQNEKNVRSKIAEVFVRCLGFIFHKVGHNNPSWFHVSRSKLIADTYWVCHTPSPVQRLGVNCKLIKTFVTQHM